MDYYNRDSDEIADAINDLRSDNYDAFRNVTSDDIETYLNHKYTDLEIDSLRVSEDTHLEDLPFEENSLKVTGVVRGEDTFIEVDNDFSISLNSISSSFRSRLSFLVPDFEISIAGNTLFS